MATDGPTDEELAKAKQFLIGSYALRFDSSTKIADQLVALQVDDLGLDYINKRNQLIAAVTKDDIKRSAAKLLADGDLLVVAVGQPSGFDGAVRIAVPATAAALGQRPEVPAARTVQ
jgi:zinc protease